MLIQSIENKFKLAFAVSIGSFLTSIIITGGGLYHANQLIENSGEYIYALDAGIPVLLRRTDVDFNRKAEYKGHIKTFHTLFFTLVPDDKYIEQNLKEAMYLIDNSGIIEYNNLKEKGYYNAIISSSSILSIRTDSINIDMKTMKFTFYGTQRIERETRIIKRQLVTEGSIEDLSPRSENNPFGAIIHNWRTVMNKDISNEKKRVF